MLPNIIFIDMQLLGGAKVGYKLETPKEVVSCNFKMKNPCEGSGPSQGF